MMSGDVATAAASPTLTRCVVRCSAAKAQTAFEARDFGGSIVFAERALYFDSQGVIYSFDIELELATSATPAMQSLLSLACLPC